MNMFNFQDNDNERTPTIKELEKRYNIKLTNRKYPYGEHDTCCASDEFIMDFISHRHRYHKMPMDEVMKELDQFMSEIFERHTKQNEDLR